MEKPTPRRKCAVLRWARQRNLPRTHPGASSLSSRRVVAWSAFTLPIFKDTWGPIFYQWYMHPPGPFAQQFGPPGFFLPQRGRLRRKRDAGCSRYAGDWGSGRSRWFRVCHVRLLFLSVSGGNATRNLRVKKFECLFGMFREIRSMLIWVLPR